MEKAELRLCLFSVFGIVSKVFIWRIHFDCRNILNNIAIMVIYIKTLYIDITDGFPDYLKSALNPNWLQKEKSDKPFALIFYNGNLREPVFAGIFSEEKYVTETKEYLLDMSDLKKRVHAVDVQNGFAEE